MRGRLVKIDIFSPLDSFRRDLEGPGKKERNRETENYEQNDEADCPVGNLKKRKDLGRDLNEQPGHDRVGNRDLVDVASFKLSEEITRIHSRKAMCQRTLLVNPQTANKVVKSGIVNCSRDLRAPVARRFKPANFAALKLPRPSSARRHRNWPNRQLPAIAVRHKHEATLISTK